MSRGRFGLLLGLLAVVVTILSFLAGVAILDDGAVDEPPGAGTTAEGDPADPADTTTTTGEPETGPLTTPAWVVVVFSEGDESTAASRAEQVTGAGFPAGVLRSDDYPSLRPGFWVAYAGPYPDSRAAASASENLVGAGFTNSYVRCVGTTDEC